MPNVSVEAVAVYTNHIPSGAFRGFGSPQVTFAAECQVNKLAEKLGRDPVEFRLRNLIKEGQLTSLGTPLPAGISIEKVVRTCAQTSRWLPDKAFTKKPRFQTPAGLSAKRILTGRGFAIGYKSFGIPPDECWAEVELHGDAEVEQAVVRFAGADMGQGSQTIYARFASHALDLPLNKISVISADTDETLDAGSASASRLTFMSGNSIFAAAKIAKEKWAAEERPAVGRSHYQSPLMISTIDGETRQHPNFGYGYVAQSVELSLDVLTGQIKILNADCAIDVGKAINPIHVLGQTEGAIIQALGYSTQEELHYRNAELLSHGLSTYLVPTIADIPPALNTVILEEADPNGPLGVRGMAEMPMVTLAPAIAAALYDACGIWFDSLPFTPERVLPALNNSR